MNLVSQGIVLIGGSVVLSSLGVWLVRRRFPVDILQRHHEVGSLIIGLVGTMYAIMLGFMVVITWQAFKEATLVVEHEANYLGDLSRVAMGFPPEKRDPLTQAMRDYARYVVTEEWDAMAQQSDSDHVSESLNTLWRMYIQEIQPQTSVESVLYPLSLRLLQDLTDRRRIRLQYSRNTLPTIFWILLWSGGGITVLCSYFFAMESTLSQAIMTAVLAAMIALMLLLILALNNPFQGDVRVSPRPIREQMENIQDRIDRGTF